MARTSDRLDLAARLRKCIERSGLSRFALAKEAGVSYAIVHRFIGGTRDVTLTTASKSCEVLGLDLQPVRRRTGK